MRRCPVCEKEQIQGLVCDNCGFDASCDYEQNRTLYSALPNDAKTISVRRLEWEHRQTSTQAPGILACSQCGKKGFFISTDTLECICMSCGTKMPLSDTMKKLERDKRLPSWIAEKRTPPSTQNRLPSWIKVSDSKAAPEPEEKRTPPPARSRLPSWIEEKQTPPSTQSRLPSWIKISDSEK